MIIEQIQPNHLWSRKEVAEINVLLRHMALSNKTIKPVNAAYLGIVATNAILLVIRDGKKIIGIGSLAVIIAPAHQTGRIEDMVVHAKYRGRGLGKKMAKALITRARKLKLGRIDLTSHPDRVRANELYLSLGFKLIAEGVVNFYTLHLKSGK